MKGLISIIIPVYNVEKYVEKCLNSVINQTYRNLEIIIVNDGATDSSVKICTNFSKKDKRISIINRENGGVSRARNIGLELSNGEYVLFIDSDDYIENDMIKKMIDYLEQTESDIVCCNYYIEVNETEKKVNRLDTCAELGKKSYIKNLVNPNGICGYLWNKLYKREVLEQNGTIIKFDEDIKIMEDLLYNLKIAEKIKKVSYIDEPLYHYIQRENSALSNKDILRMKSSLFVYPRIVEILEYYKIEESNNYKLSFIIESSIVKIYSNDYNNIEAINKIIKKYLKENIFLKKGSVKIKIKALVLLYFPFLYKILKNK